MASYDTINAQTVAQVLAASPNAQQEAWADLVIRKSNDYSVLYDNLTGVPGSGKAFIQKNDLNITAGNLVHIPMVGGTRGPGLQGGGDRAGREQSLNPKDFSFTVGRWWDAYKVKDVVLSETVIGARWDRNASMFLRRNLGIKKTDDMLMELRARATERNTVYAGNKNSVAALRTADTFSTATVTRVASVLTSLSAKPITIGRSAAGHAIRKFMMLNTQFGLETFLNSNTYNDYIANADERGSLNALFTGNVLPWKGQGIYQWDVEDPEDIAPAGCPLLPRAFLGTAITAGSAAVDIKGGGSATAAANTDVLFFGYFNNAEYVGCEGVKISANTSTVRYAAIKHLTGATPGAIMYASFKVNTGNKLTMFQRLGPSAAADQVTTLGGITWGTGTYGTNAITLADRAPEGSLVVEVNEYGVPIADGLGLGEMAGVMGHGTLDGRNAMGARTEYHAPHGSEHAIGIETVFGTRAFERLDGQPGGYVLIRQAVPLEGFPVVV